MKKLCSLVLLFAMVISMFGSIKVTAADLFGNREVLLYGKMISVEEFLEEFEDSKGACKTLENYSDVTASISDVKQNSVCDKVNIDVYDADGNKLGSVNASGNYYTGYREQVSDAKSLVFAEEEPDLENETKLLLFELVAGESGNNYFVDDFVTKESAVRVILQQGECLYIFEDVMPEMFSEKFETHHDQISDPQKDILWYSTFIQPKTQETITSLDSEALGRIDKMASAGLLGATGATRWVNDTTYQTSFNMHGDKWVERSLPFGYYRITDLTHSDTTWKAEFYIDESIQINGRKVSGYDNLIRYKNMQISVTCGKESEILSTSVSGRVYSGSNETSGVAFDLLSACCDWWDIGTSLVNVYLALTDTGRDVKLGSSAYSGFPSGTTCVGVKTSGSTVLFNNSYKNGGAYTSNPAHYLIVQVGTCSAARSGNAAVSTKGCVTFKWDAYLNSDFSSLAKGTTKKFEVKYTSKY